MRLHNACMKNTKVLIKITSFNLQMANVHQQTYSMSLAKQTSQFFDVIQTNNKNKCHIFEFLEAN